MAVGGVISDLGFGNIGVWFSTLVFWLIIGCGFFIFVIACLYIKKTRRLIYPVIEITDLGGGKVGIRNTKAGWFKSQTMFFGLIEKGGEQKLRLKDGREIQNASSVDFHDINGKRGVLIQRKGDDPKVLLPITKSKFGRTVIIKKDKAGNIIKKVQLDPDSIDLVNTIAPADYRDTSAKILQQSQDETMGKLEKFMQQALPFVMTGVFIVALIFIIQYAKHTQAEAYKHNLDAIKASCSNVATVIKSSTAPLLLGIKRKWFKRW